MHDLLHNAVPGESFILFRVIPATWSVSQFAAEAFKQLERDVDELMNALRDFVRGVPKA